MVLHDGDRLINYTRRADSPPICLARKIQGDSARRVINYRGEIKQGWKGGQGGGHSSKAMTSRDEKF